MKNLKHLKKFNETNEQNDINYLKAKQVIYELLSILDQPNSNAIFNSIASTIIDYADFIIRKYKYKEDITSYNILTRKFIKESMDHPDYKRTKDLIFEMLSILDMNIDRAEEIYNDILKLLDFLKKTYVSKNFKPSI